MSTTIFGDSGSIRDYLYVEDAVKSNLPVFAAGDGQIYNIGTGRQTSLKELSSKVKATIGIEMAAAHAPQKLGKVDKVALTYHKIQWDLGWSPLISLEEGLKKAVRFYRTPNHEV